MSSACWNKVDDDGHRIYAEAACSSLLIGDFLMGRQSMLEIRKYRETMSSKERVKRTFEFGKTDRVTIGYETNEGIHGRLSKALGIPDGNMELVKRAIGVDYRGISADYIGPQLYHAPPGRGISPLEGGFIRWIEHEGGGFWESCDFPLADATDEQFNHFPVPDPDHFDYEGARGLALSYGNEYGLHVGDPGFPDIINSNGRIMGMEDVLCHLATEDEAALRFIRRRAVFQLGYLERLLETCHGLIDFVWLGEDLGTQIAPMISPAIFRKIIKPIHKDFCDLAAQHELPVIIHTCGSSSWAYEGFIEIGVRAVDTLQPEAANMSPRYLVDHFGGRLGFRGCISTAGTLTYGNTCDVEQTCRETLDIMMSYKGYHFAPTHQIQDNTPVENVMAMYNAAHQYGRY
jgi:uroporphyrinogen decarboxylase